MPIEQPQIQRSFWFDELSTKEAAAAAENRAVIIFPVGAVEEHGSHLPLCTDSLQPEYIALEVAKKTGCFILPTLKYGVCNAARNFPGTLTIEFDTLYKITYDILSELTRNNFRRILILSGHAGQSHMVALRLAAQKVVLQNDSSTSKTRILVLSDYDFADELKTKFASSQDGHAGTIETSRVMAIRPELVKGEGETSFPEMPRFEIVAHPERYFPSGVIGDPALASAEKGKQINEHIVEQIVNLVEQLKAK